MSVDIYNCSNSIIRIDGKRYQIITKTLLLKLGGNDVIQTATLKRVVGPRIFSKLLFEVENTLLYNERFRLDSVRMVTPSPRRTRFTQLFLTDSSTKRYVRNYIAVSGTVYSISYFFVNSNN